MKYFPVSHIMIKFYAATGAMLATASMAAAGAARPPVEASDGSNGGLIVLLVIGALMLIHGPGDADRSKTSTDDADDDVIMKF